MTAIIQGYKGKTLISLGKQKWSPGAKLSFKVPQDIVAKEFPIVANGKVVGTYGGTKPVLNPLGVLNAAISEISLSRKGTDRVKSIRGTRVLSTTQERKFGAVDGTIYKTNSATLAYPTLEGTPVLGTTGQDVAFRESRTLMMENKLSGAWHPTLFNTKDLNTAAVNIACTPDLSGLQDPYDANACTYSGDIEIEVFASCSDFQLDNPESQLADFNQNFQELEFAGAITNSRQWITPQGMLQGMNITCLHSGNKPIDYASMAKTRFEIKYQGIQLFEGTLADFLEVDILKTHCPRRMGSAYVNFLNNMDFLSGLYIAEGKNLELIMSTDSALSYTIPVKFIFDYDQVIFNAQAPAKVA